MKAFYTPSGKKVERAAIYCRVSGKGQEDNRIMTTRSNVMPWRRKSGNGTARAMSTPKIHQRIVQILNDRSQALDLAFHDGRATFIELRVAE
jgi:hypothetical protein